jgi:cellulose synthase (UDP-forming)
VSTAREKESATVAALGDAGLAGPPYRVDMLCPRQQLEYRILVSLWVLCVVFFWSWWLDGHHVVGWLTFWINSLLLVWTTALPGYYFFFLSRMQRANPALPIPQDLAVAMVVTKAPSEPFSIVKNTLRAMLAQAYPHDTWLADEDPDPDTLRWCHEHGVRVSSRRGVPGYHRSSWPRRTRCKEGNLAYFYDTYGYRRYEVVVQLDADQRPGPGYLEEMLHPFADPRVGYVSAPSVCDANAAQSWAARGRLYAEGTLHGSLQAGYSRGSAPLCIGSHYAVRTSALQEIGGLGPELAEDHSTTLMLNAKGWRGVHAVDADAHGDGPVSFADCMTQEFQWSRSLTNILLTVLPRHWHALPRTLRLQFLFAELWYPAMGISMLLGHLLPILALLMQTSWVRVNYLGFVVHKVPMTCAAFAIVRWVRKHGWLRPRDAHIMAWESVLFQLTRWPWILMGAAAGLMDACRGRVFDVRVTPKGHEPLAAVPYRTLAPYASMVVMSSLVVILQSHPGPARGYYYLAIVNGFVYAAVVATIVCAQAYEAKRVRGSDGGSPAPCPGSDVGMVGAAG